MQFEVDDATAPPFADAVFDIASIASSRQQAAYDYQCWPPTEFARSWVRLIQPSPFDY
jgi:hypothetical protein